MPIPEKVSDSSSWAADGRWSELNVKHLLTFLFLYFVDGSTNKERAIQRTEDKGINDDEKHFF